jgi:NAD(P)-dependent dehydrogenase (short-subunit alcohol dehydrogenase family)
MPGGLEGKVAVVTGGGSGIGQAICLAFARDGADVVVASNVAVDAERVAQELRDIGRTAIAVDIDVTDADAVDRMAALVAETLGPADILVTSAGVMGARQLITDTGLDEWRRTIEVNLTAGFTCIKAFLPAMLERDQGRIITIASMSGKLPAAMNADYAASKHGVIGLTKALALELGLLGKNGITANAICPGTVATPMMDAIATHFAGDAPGDRATFDEIALAKSIQRRYLDPDEIAAMARYLASDDARGITGQALSVDGGAVIA